MNDSTPDSVDTSPAWPQMLLFALQHVLVMAAAPITSVFLVAKALDLPSDLIVNLISATFLMCGLGAVLQSLGTARLGAKLPFVMVPGGAPVVMFLGIAQQRDLQTACGAVILTSLFYFLVLPVFSRLLRFFPKIVIGTLLLLVSINLLKVYGSIIVGKPGSADFASLSHIGLALATIALTLLFARIFKGTLGQLAVLLGLIAGTLLAAALGQTDFSAVAQGPVLSLPTFLPFGPPKFDLAATVPLLVFSVISMVEATGQTMAVAEMVGSKDSARTLVPRTIRGDAVMSLAGGFFGTSMIITSGENIGLVRATQVRSRYVTALAGVMLALVAVLAPLGRLANAIPAPVVSATAIIIFAIIGTIGIDILRKVDLHQRSNMYVLAGALTMGLLPILVPGFYSQFPKGLQPILGNGLAMGSITAVVLNLLFHGVGQEPTAPAAAAAPFSSKE
ncbi:uracil-xanthine permease family protein [Comamonas odontotermitis]|uniref:uracil-xanthine permease family protein n=1 Tax=Comamonas odontotermitis TaxID=379895 RepID=UPI00375252DE